MKKIGIGWFSTGRDPAARKLLKTVWDHIKRGEIEVEISFVFSNREPGESIESDLFFGQVDKYGIPLICFSSRKFQIQKGVNSISDCRLEYDREAMEKLKHFLQPDLCVLAGYILIVGEEMCHKYNMINLHPAAPSGPTGTWQEVIWKLIAGKAEYSGVMMHLVTPELDKGPPVTYCTFPIRDESNRVLWEGAKEGKRSSKRNLFNDIRYRRGLPREFPLIVATLKAFSQGKVRIEEGRIINDKEEVIAGYNLTEEIDTAIGNQVK
jgi:folate-dependent phosphoribosylglycinamide formyltransferase PurN